MLLLVGYHCLHSDGGRQGNEEEYYISYEIHAKSLQEQYDDNGQDEYPDKGDDQLFTFHNLQTPILTRTVGTEEYNKLLSRARRLLTTP